MSAPMKVMMNTIIIDSGSRANARSKRSWPAASMFQSVFWRNRSLAGREYICAKARSATRNDRIIMPMAMPWFHLLPMARWIRMPKSELISAPMAGKSGMSQRYPAWWTTVGPSSWMACSISLSHQVRGADVDGLEGVEDAQDDGQSHRGLGRGQDHHEEREGLAGHAADHEAVEGDEVHVGGVEHELDAHQDGHRVAPGEHREEPAREEQRGDGQEVGEGGDHGRLRPSRPGSPCGR